MAEAAAGPGFQLGRPRYDQVSRVRAPPRRRRLQAARPSALRPAADAATSPQSCVDPRAPRSAAGADQLWLMYRRFRISFDLVFCCYASRRVAGDPQRCGAATVTVVFVCKFHSNHKLLNVLLALHLIALMIT